MKHDPDEFADLEPVDELDDLEPIDELEPVEDPEPVEAPEPPPPPPPPPAAREPEPKPVPPPAAPAKPAPVTPPPPPPPPPPPAASVPVVPPRELPAPAPVSAPPPAPEPAASAAPAGPLEELPATAAPGLHAGATPSPEPVPGTEAAAVAAPGAAAEPGTKRELERAPQLLRKASKILLVGALFPWLVALKSEGGAVAWGPWAAAKVVALLAAWAFHQGFVATHGGRAVGFLDKLAKVHKVAVPALSGLIAIGAFVIASQSPELNFGAAAGELATLLLAAATFSHIFGYEHGGKFNPIFPLMFLGPGIAGLLGVFGGATALGGDSPGIAALGLVGTVVVAAGGLMAMYVMYVAMKQAKVEGDLKRAAAREARKAQRGGGGGRRAGAARPRR